MCPVEQATITFTAHGHTNVRATHRSTLAITTESDLTLRGDCIIGVHASQSPQIVNAVIGRVLRCPSSQITTRFIVGDFEEEVHGLGAINLTLRDKHSLVWRTSAHIDDRTIAIRCDKAAVDLNRSLVQHLQDPNAILQVVILASVSVS